MTPAIRVRRLVVASIAVAAAASTMLSMAPASTAADGPVVLAKRSAVTRSPVLTLSGWTPRASELVLVAVAHQSWRRLQVRVKGNGLTFRRVSEVRNSQGIQTLTLFRAQGRPTAGRITVVLPGNSGAASAV